MNEMKMYSHKGAYPNFLPNRIRLSNGEIRTDVSTFTEEELSDAGYVEAPDSPFYEYPNRLDWIDDRWVVREPNETEIAQKWDEVKKRCETLLFETDYKVVKAYEQQVPVEPEWVQYRQSLRDIHNKVGYDSPWFINWPTPPNGE